MPPLSATLQKTADKVDIVSFGSFPQDDTGRKTPIEWLVLEVSDGTALLLSRYGLAARPYHAAPGAVTWADCDLRGGLNHDFLMEAFFRGRASPYHPNSFFLRRLYRHFCQSEINNLIRKCCTISLHGNFC
jgi:hypothetical protein